MRSGRWWPSQAQLCLRRRVPPVVRCRRLRCVPPTERLHEAAQSVRGPVDAAAVELFFLLAAYPNRGVREICEFCDPWVRSFERDEPGSIDVDLAEAHVGELFVALKERREFCGPYFAGFAGGFSDDQNAERGFEKPRPIVSTQFF